MFELVRSQVLCVTCSGNFGEVRRKTMTESSISDLKQAVGGIQDGYHGNKYQFKLLEYFAFRASQSNINFKLATELSEFGKFDDLIYEYTSKNGDKKIWCLQAKHRKNPTVMGIPTLFCDRDFLLYKYCESLLRVESTFDNIELYVLATNNLFPPAADNGVVVLRGVGEEALYFRAVTNGGSNLVTLGTQYEFISEQNTLEGRVNHQVLYYNFLTFELAHLLFDTKKVGNSGILKKSQMFLKSQVFHDDWKFRPSILQDPTFSNFRSAFKRNVTEVLKDNKLLVDQDEKLQIRSDFWKFWGNFDFSEKLESFLDFSLPDQELQESQKEMETSIQIFIEKLKFLVDVKIDDIDREIREGFEKEKNLKTVTWYANVLEKGIISWFTNNKDCMPLTNSDYDSFFLDFEFDSDIKNLVRMKGNLFKDQIIDFKERDLIIEEFLETAPSKKGRILNIVTPDGETFFSCIEVYRLMVTEKDDTLLFAQTCSPEEEFQKCLKVFESRNSFRVGLIECGQNSEIYLKYENEFHRILSQHPGKKLIIVNEASSTGKITSDQVCKKGEILIRELTDSARESILSNTKLNLQNSEIFWKDLVHSDEIPLKYLLETRSICGTTEISKNYDRKLYISRTLVQFNQMKLEIKQKLRGKVAYSWQEFQDVSVQKPGKVPHFLEKDNETLVWRKSSGEIANLRQFIDPSGSTKYEEDEIVSSPPALMIISDIAGMGKSTLLNRLAIKLKEKYPDHFVLKMDLNDYTRDLDSVDNKYFREIGRVVSFLATKFLKIERECDLRIFEGACTRTGKVILVFDGVDEVAIDYKDKVLSIIRSLRKTAIKSILISTRPECSNFLEEAFNVLKHSILPFTREDQETFLKNYLREKTEITEKNLSPVSKALINIMEKSISDNERKFTGVPLITMLLGEYFKTIIKSINNYESLEVISLINVLKMHTINLFDLYESFIDESLNIYFLEKLKMDDTNPRAKRNIIKEKQRLLEMYQKVGVGNIFPRRILEVYLPEFTSDPSEADVEEMIGCGLINEKLKYEHQTYSEFLTVKLLNENQSKGKVIQLLLTEVFLRDGYQVLRSFINSVIWKKGFDSQQVFGEQMMQFEDEAFEALVISAKEQNTHIFHFMIKSLSHQKIDQIERFLMKTNQYGCIFLFYYFRHCDGASNLLDILKENFEMRLVQQILLFSNQGPWFWDTYNPIMASARHGSNIVQVAKWLISNFRDDLEFLQGFFLLRDASGNGILQKSLLCSVDGSFFQLLDSIKGFRSVFDIEFLMEFSGMKNNKLENFLYQIVESKEESSLTLTKICQWLKDVFTGEKDFLKNLLFSRNELEESILFRYGRGDENLVILLLEFVKEEFGFESLKQYLELLNPKGETFIYKTCTFKLAIHKTVDLEVILGYLDRNFKDDHDFMRKLLFQKSERGTILHLFTRRIQNSQAKDLLLELLNWTSRILGKESLMELLLIRDENNEIFLHKILSCYFKKEAYKVLEEVLKIVDRYFGEDSRFLEELFTSTDKNGNSILMTSSIWQDEALPILKLTFDWIAGTMGHPFLRKLILLESQDSKNFLFTIFEVFFQYNKITILVQVLELISTYFPDDREFFTNLLFSSHSENFGIHFQSKCAEDNLLKKKFSVHSDELKRWFDGKFEHVF